MIGAYNIIIIYSHTPYYCNVLITRTGTCNARAASRLFPRCQRRRPRPVLLYYYIRAPANFKPVSLVLWYYIYLLSLLYPDTKVKPAPPTPITQRVNIIINAARSGYAISLRQSYIIHDRTSQ